MRRWKIVIDMDDKMNDDIEESRCEVKRGMGWMK